MIKKFSVNEAAEPAEGAWKTPDLRLSGDHAMTGTFVAALRHGWRTLRRFCAAVRRQDLSKSHADEFDALIGIGLWLRH